MSLLSITNYFPFRRVRITGQSVADKARHFGLAWKTVMNIDKAFLEEEYGQIDYVTGRVVWMGKGRKKETLDAFFAGMSEEQKASVEAVAMDMWRAYINSVKEALPHAKIVFDLFHVVAAFNKVIDTVQTSDKKKASKEHKDVLHPYQPV